jgi:hypothetical protein
VGLKNLHFYAKLIVTSGLRSTLRDSGFREQRREISRCPICTGNISVDRHWWQMSRMTDTIHFLTLFKKGNLEVEKTERLVVTMQMHHRLQLDLPSCLSSRQTPFTVLI